ncbi:DUF6236 family protein [Saccharothrix variisporea]|uniref:Uncharacterized protein n=1 Tax=Saccharothrix variisporea TaxID=543527 RepID=A0A495X6C5_9PSEU|nr:DUF6236 family protein [Saccharothrix variisporea]RKT69447.1 hypothetical protein DFJ66_2676 [Saccharothrix variisporea]
MPSLFYYPKINAPRSVIDQAVLYWDSLVTVAPPGPVKSFLDRRMRQVHEAGLYTRLEADHWPQWSDAKRSFDLLWRLMKQIPPDDLIFGLDADEFMYEEKLSYALLVELFHRGLIRKVPGGGRGRVKASTALQLCLISTAARDIAGAARDRGQSILYPHTDIQAAHALAHLPVDHEVDSGLDPGRSQPGRPVLSLEVEIGGLLPVPDHEVAVQDLIVFRERYSDERRRLITAVDRLVGDLRQHHDHPRAVLAAIRQELERALADLEHAGRSARLTWRRRSLTISIALASAYAGQKLFPEAGWFLGAVSGTAINIATNTTRPTNSSMANDVSYLHRVRSALART